MKINKKISIPNDRHPRLVRGSRATSKDFCFISRSPHKAGMTSLIFLITTSLLNGCSLAPDFAVPDMALPPTFKAAEKDPMLANATQDLSDWKPAVSLEKEDRGQWWKIFGDDALNDLEKQAITENNSLKAAAARVEQARGIVRANAFSILPNIDLGGNAVRAKSADASNAPFSSAPTSKLKPYNLYSANAATSYEVDLFGKVRDTEGAFNFDADAQDALYKNTLLALQADVAQHYFLLQAIDAERALLKETVTVRTEAQRIMQKRLAVGSVSEVELSQSDGDLANAKADLIGLDRQRAVLENAMAILLGKNPSEYHFAETPLANTQPPLIPADIPSEVLQRRPDIASATAGMAAANERIGVARTAFFPSLILTANGGTQSTKLADIFKWSSRSWAIGQTAGSAIALNLLDSGRNLGNLDAAHAAYEEAVANYRQQVLVAMGDVENALSDQKLLAEQSREQEIAASTSTRAHELTKKRYDNGDVNYFEVVEAQRTMLNANRAAIQTRGARQTATISLIRAIGGGWSENISEQPTE